MNESSHDQIQIISTPEGTYVTEAPTDDVITIMPIAVWDAEFCEDTGTEDWAGFVVDTGVSTNGG